MILLERCKFFSLVTEGISGLRLLAKKEPDYFPDPSEEEITDKSKPMA